MRRVVNQNIQKGKFTVVLFLESKFDVGMLRIDEFKERHGIPNKLYEFNLMTQHAKEEDLLKYNKHTRFCIRVFTYSELSSFRFANTLSGRNVSAFEDNSL